MIKIDGKIIEQNHFPDKTLLLKNLPLSDPFTYIKIEWYYENDAELFTLICARKHYGDEKVSLYIPYLPHARQDRIKNFSDVFTLKYFCEIINSLDFYEVQVLDVHSNVSLALLDRVREIKPTKYITKVIGDIREPVLFFPDEGAMKRYSDMIKMPYAFGIKKRNWEDGKILGLDLVNAEIVKGKNVLIVDDICSRGGTFYHAAKALKKAGAASIYLYVSHLEESVLKGDLWKEMLNSKLINYIYTPNPLFDRKTCGDPDAMVRIVKV